MEQKKTNVEGNGNIVIQNIEGSNITINPDNSEEVKKLIINLGNNMDKLPQDIFEIIKEKQKINTTNESNANIYLTLLLQTNGIEHFFRFGITITNLTKEIRYFNQPFFKVFPAFDLKNGGKQDTFVMIDDQNKTNFPVRLEYGQPISTSYPIKKGIIENYKQILAENTEAYIQCFINTTVGELFESNKYKISELLNSIL